MYAIIELRLLIGGASSWRQERVEIVRTNAAASRGTARAAPIHVFAHIAHPRMVPHAAQIRLAIRQTRYWLCLNQHGHEGCSHSKGNQRTKTHRLLLSRRLPLETSRAPGILRVT